MADPISPKENRQLPFINAWFIFAPEKILNKNCTSEDKDRKQKVNKNMLLFLDNIESYENIYE